MPAPTTGEELLELVRKSSAVDEKRLTSYLERVRAEPFPQEPAKLAGVLVRDRILTRFQAEQFLQGKWRRFTIGKYRVLDRIGIGGMGSVYLCEHKFMRRPAAVKVLPTVRAKDPSALERFYREARAVAALDHPNIVRAYDIDEDDGLHFLVMEYVDGSSLQEIVRREGPLDPYRAADYISQAAKGLQHAHEAATIVHRDIKPGNLIVDRAGVVKVLDMGLARFFNDESDLLTKKFDENVLGTADYLAPEQVLDSHGVDIRADIYSLGATFYFCLTGRTPFGEGTVAQKLIWHQTRRPRTVLAFRPDVPEGIVAVLQKMMAKDVADRYQTPGEVVNALSPWVTPRAAGSATSKTGTALEQANNRSGSEVPQSPEPARRDSELAKLSQAKPRRKWTVSEGAQRENGSDPKPGVKVDSPVPVSQSKRIETGFGADRRPADPDRSEEDSAVDIILPSIPNPEPGEEGEGSAWGRLSTDTPNPRSKQDTARNIPIKLSEMAYPPSRRLVFRENAEKSLRKRSPKLYWGFVGSSLIVSALLILAAWLTPSDEEPLKASRSATIPPAEVQVLRGTEGKGIFRELTTLLSRATPGQRIIVDAPEIEGFLDATNLKSMTIEAAPGRKVVWRLPEKQSGVTKVIYFHDVQDVVFQGFVIDGEGRVPYCAELAMKCPGLKLQNLELRGFTNSGVLIANCAGLEDRPVALTELKLKAEPERDTGFSFAINPKISEPGVNDYIYISNCRFTGLKSRWRLQSPEANGPYVELHE